MTYATTNKMNDVRVEVSTFEQFFKEKAVYPIAIEPINDLMYGM